MKISDIFKNYFSAKNLHDTFYKHVVYSKATGIDNLDQYAFRAQLDEQISILSRKAIAGNYNFTKYKLKLISKGKNKFPREISIPTIRDRIALRSLCNFLTEVYRDSIGFELPQKIAKKVKNDLNDSQYNTYIKLDVNNFYPSIKHKELMSRLGKKIRHPPIKNLILSAITSPTVSASKPSDLPSARGVPQGLAISNILAAIYLSNIDKRLNSMTSIKYYRYVDDVLIFCNYSEKEDILKKVIRMFGEVGLKVYDPVKTPEKSSIGSIENGFGYLGYQFYGNKVTARISSVERLKNSLVSIFTSYKYSKKKSEDVFNVEVKFKNFWLRL